MELWSPLTSQYMKMVLPDAQVERVLLQFYWVLMEKLPSKKKDPLLLTMFMTFISLFQVLKKIFLDSEYPTVDGKLSIGCYLKALEECYVKLKGKRKGKNLISESNFFCFHSPFYKMVQKAYAHLHKLENPSSSPEEINKVFMEKVHPSLQISQRIGNIYTGSLYSCLISLLVSGLEIVGKNVMLFSYGSGLCSSMLTAKIHSNPLDKTKI